MSNAETVIALDAKRMAAMPAKDVDVLNDILADDLVYVHSSARIDTKKSLIDNMFSGATVYKAVKPSGVTATDLGDAVLLSGEAAIEVSSGGNDLKFGVRFLNVYAKRDGAWKMVAWQSTKLP